MEDIIKLVITALPWLEGVVGVARVVITAIPAWGIAVPGIAGALVLFLYIFGADHLLWEEDN